MAIKIDIETSYGITIPNAYIRIDNFNGNKTHIDLDVKAYNIVEEDEVYYEYEEQEVTFEGEEGNPITQTQNVRV
jgi:5-keto 4-deoxyuronate isomerase